MRRPSILAALLVALLACAETAAAQIAVHGHRGGPYREGVPIAPENTMPAFRRAADDGFVLELDSKLSKDGVPLVIHDDTFDRTTTCTGPVSALTAAEVAQRCRADVLGVPGSTLPTAPAGDAAAPVPTLAEVLAFARERRARVNVEIKNLPTDNDFEPSPQPVYAEKILDAVDASAIPRGLVIIQSFSPANLDVAERRGFETSLLTLEATNAGGPEAARRGANEWISPGGPTDAAFVSRAHAQGLRVVPYTLDTPEEVRAAAAAAVDEVISNDPAMAARVLAAAAPAADPAAPPPSDADCAKAVAPRSLAPIRTLDPKPGAPRVFAMQFKQDSRHVVDYAAFRTKIECMVREWVVPHLAKDRPNVVAFNEDIGLATIATGSRGQVAREIFTDPSRSPACQGSAGAPCGAFGALLAVGAAYRRESTAYQARFPAIDPISGIFVATTDTFARGWMQTFSDIARRYGVYILGSNNQAPFRESTDPAEIAAFADPDLPAPPKSVFVATSPKVYNEVFMWGPGDVRNDGPRPLRNVVAQNKKVPLTSIEQLLQLTPGPATGPDAIANVEPYALPGTQARISFATSLPAFVFGEPTAADPCADVSKTYMRCLDKLGTNLVMQDEANPGPWGAYTSKDSDDAGAWQALVWMTSTWRQVVDPSVRFAYNVTPHLVGNLGDLAFDGQTAITQRGLQGPGCHYVGNARRVEGRDPDVFTVGGEKLPTAPYAGPKSEFLALAPWVVPDGPREQLEATGRELGPDGNGKLENDYLETALIADLPFPPDPQRRGCATADAADATGSGRRRGALPKLRVTVRPRRIRAGRTVALHVRVTAVRRAGRGRRPVKGAVVRFVSRTARTGRRGRAVLKVRVLRSGRRPVRANRGGFRRGRATVRVLPRR